MWYYIAHLIQAAGSYTEERAGLSFMRPEFCLDSATVKAISYVVIGTVSHSQWEHIKENTLKTGMLEILL